MIMDFSMWIQSSSDWGILFLSALFIGMSKTGIQGISLLAVPMMAMTFGAKPSTGLILPILCVADLIAVLYYRRIAEWRYILKLLPSAPLGIAAFIVFYVVFRFAITKWDLKTPGREDDDEEAEKSAVLANNDYTQVASLILEGVGGKANVASIDNCITRLRLEIRDYTAVDEKKIKSAGVAGVIRPSKTAVQVIIGTKVQFVADEFKKLCK